MILNLDNLAAALISGVLILILIVLQMRAQQANQDRVALYIAKKQAQFHFTTATKARVRAASH